MGPRATQGPGPLRAQIKAYPLTGSVERLSTTLQKLNARVLYLAQCKIAGDQQPGAGFADLFRVINEEQNLHRDQAA